MSVRQVLDEPLRLHIDLSGGRGADSGGVREAGRDVGLGAINLERLRTVSGGSASASARQSDSVSRKSS